MVRFLGTFFLPNNESCQLFSPAKLPPHYFMKLMISTGSFIQHFALTLPCLNLSPVLRSPLLRIGFLLRAFFLKFYLSA